MAEAIARSDLKERLAHCEGRLDDMTKEKDGYVRQVALREAQNQVLNAQVTELMQKNKTLQEQSKKDLEHLRDREALFIREKEETSTEMASVMQQLAEETAVNKDLRESNHRLTMELASCTAELVQLGQTKKKVKLLTMQAESLESELSNVNAHLTECRSQGMVWEQQVKVLRSRCQDLEHEKGELADELTHCQAISQQELQAKESRWRSEREAMELRLQAEADNKHQATSQLHARLAGATQEVEDLTCELERAQRDLTTSSALLTTTKEKLIHLQEEKEQLQKELVANKELLSQEAGTRSDMMVSHQAAVSALEAEVQILKGTVECHLHRVNDLQGQLEVSELRMEHLREEHNQALGHREVELQSLRQENKQLKAQAETVQACAREEVEQLKGEVEQMKRRLEESQGELGSARTLLEERNSQRNREQQECEALTGQCRVLQLHVEHLQWQLSQEQQEVCKVKTEMEDLLEAKAEELEAKDKRIAEEVSRVEELRRKVLRDHDVWKSKVEDLEQQLRQSRETSAESSQKQLLAEEAHKAALETCKAAQKKAKHYKKQTRKLMVELECHSWAGLDTSRSVSSWVEPPCPPNIPSAGPPKDGPQLPEHDEHAEESQSELAILLQGCKRSLGHRGPCK